MPRYGLITDPSRLMKSRLGGVVERVNYRGYFRYDAHCYVEIRRGPEHSLLMITEAPDNQGTSVTNCAEGLASMLMHQYKLDPARTTYLERYLYDGAGEPELIDSVAFQWNKDNRASQPVWRRLSSKELEALLSLVQP